MMTAAPKEPPGIPLPTSVAAIWGAFLYEGLLTHGHDHHRLAAILDSWANGCIELVMATCQHLPEVWSQISRKWESEDADFPGVFEYEVISPLGEWLGDYLLRHDGSLPDSETVRHKIQSLITEFFPAPVP